MLTRGGRLALAGTVLISAGATAALVKPTEQSPFPSSSAVAECGRLGDYEYACKIDGWTSSVGGQACLYEGEDDVSNAVSIFNNDGTSFGFAASSFMGAAIVAGANGANVYSYAGRKTSFDTFLEAPGNGTGIPPEIRSATFCWNEEDREFECTEESAWADGEAFNSVYRSYWHSFQIGNWAGTYHINDVPQAATLVVNEEPIGQAMFSHDLNGEVMITVALYEPWRFANRMDSRGNIADNVHIQGYIEAPTRYPSPKYFDHTMLAEESPFSTKVDMRPYYAVHVDVTRCTSTENTPSGDDTPPAEDDTPED